VKLVLSFSHVQNRPESALNRVLRPVSIPADSARTKVPIFPDSKIVIQADSKGLEGKIGQNGSKQKMTLKKGVPFLADRVMIQPSRNLHGS